MKRLPKIFLTWIFIFSLCLVYQADLRAAAKPNCKTACAAALKATGNSAKIKYTSKNAFDFGGFSASARKKVSSIMYLCDAKEVYSICVVKAGSRSDANTLYKTLKSYKTNNCSSGYLSDYSKEEQKVLTNAVCGKKGKYVWYIAMSENKATNTKGQRALKTKL